MFSQSISCQNIFYFLTVYTVYAVCMYICATWPGFEGLKCQEYNFHGQEGGALLENSKNLQSRLITRYAI